MNKSKLKKTGICLSAIHTHKYTFSYKKTHVDNNNDSDAEKDTKTQLHDCHARAGNRIYMRRYTPVAGCRPDRDPGNCSVHRRRRQSPTHCQNLHTENCHRQNPFLMIFKLNNSSPESENGTPLARLYVVACSERCCTCVSDVDVVKYHFPTFMRTYTSIVLK